MTIFQIILLSIVEGVTEFLPISSTAHLILAEKLLKIENTEFLKSFDIIIQLGAILAICLLYYRKFTLTSIKLWKNVLIAFIPTGIIGVSLYPLIKSYLLGNSSIAATSLVIGGILLIIFDKYQHKLKSQNPTTKNYLQIGLFQALSVIPGVSRSASSIIGGMFAGLDRVQAVEFSFFLAIPTMLAATTLDLIKSNNTFTNYEYLILGIGMIVSFLSATISVKAFVNYVSKHQFTIFAIYRIAIGILFLLLT